MPRVWFWSGSIEADSDVEILDPNVYICTISEGGRIDMEMRLKRGRGYVFRRQELLDADLGIGFYPGGLGPTRPCWRKVNYIVEAARLGQITDYDKLSRWSIWTNWNDSSLGRRARRSFGEAC